MTRPLYAYAYAHVPFDDAVTLLADDPEDLLATATGRAVDRAGEIVGQLRVDAGGFEFGRDIRISVGTAHLAEPHRLVLPLEWHAAEAALLFPTVDAHLEVSLLSVHPPMVQVTLVGEYDPPFGPLGEVLDRTMTHRVAEAVVHAFVNDAASRLTDLVAATVEPPLAAARTR